jgi:hypothetical protein
MPSSLTFKIVDPVLEAATGEEGRLRDELGVRAFGIYQANWRRAPKALRMTID